jgi:hypothetical protein
VISIVLGIVLVMAACAPRQASETSDVAAEVPDAAWNYWSMESNCATCHVAEDTSAMGQTSLLAVHEVDVEARGLGCTDCHSDEATLVDAHQDMGSGAPTKLVATQVDEQACLVCHDRKEIVVATVDLAVLRDSVGTTVNPHGLPANPDHDVITCASCHKMHSEEATVLAVSPQTCIECHHMGVYECGTCH